MKKIILIKNYKNMSTKIKILLKNLINSNFKWQNDPKQFFISLSRYKFVSRILRGKKCFRSRMYRRI